MLTDAQIQTLHQLYYAERWPIRKIERHLDMGWRTIKKYLPHPISRPLRALGPANSIPSKPLSPIFWRRIPR